MAGDPYGYDERGGRGWRRQFAGALGGACAIALVWGLVSWGHGLLTRDSGQIPFLRAEEGPMKIVPEDPGGLKLARTDMAVSRIVGGTGASAVEPGLAPQPEALSEEDQPQPYLAARDPGAATSGEGETDATPTPAVMPAPDADAIDRAVARVLQEQAMESSDGSTAEAEESSSLSAVAAPPPPLRPRAPTRAEMAAAAAAAAAAQPAPVVAASSMAAGDIGIQLGAFNSEAIAQSQWRRALRRHEDLLGALAHAVTTVDSGGRTLYRLRAGPVADRRKAQELCAALKSRGEACIVATIR
ncbi:SPOR domain-containing protein [Albimonas sp. CAU 1670]|uniref:SPOR domain-containing protein n=1 Tax=Albimonas sp. CAU 1670 TaxID=3032599 RepID=UPI0023DB087B|nr:SPOR domain-containing protein [Albimonas sp. CAU 1670]MDF2232823.1 SPOR domain-containing protein [Albimonas sp. CAU 1670]